MNSFSPYLDRLVPQTEKHAEKTAGEFTTTATTPTEGFAGMDIYNPLTRGEVEYIKPVVAPPTKDEKQYMDVREYIQQENRVIMVAGGAILLLFLGTVALVMR